MTTGAALLRAILGNPDDDTVRLVYADWLEENGDAARAEFIRVQCELAKLADRAIRANARVTCNVADYASPVWVLPDDTDSGRRLRARERELFAAHRYAWFDGLLGLGWKTMGTDYTNGCRYRNGSHTTSPMRWRFGRGFPAELDVTGSDWATHGDAILAAHPVRRVRFTDGGPHWVSRIVDGAKFRLYGDPANVLIPAEEVGMLLNERLGNNPEEGRDILHAVLTLRWPSIPPDGWEFATEPEPAWVTDSAVLRNELPRSTS